MFRGALVILTSIAALAASWGVLVYTFVMGAPFSARAINASIVLWVVAYLAALAAFMDIRGRNRFRGTAPLEEGSSPAEPRTQGG